jgi:drug/metabolite transporter (DMT)-like permease
MTLTNWGLLLLTAAAFAISLPFNNVLVATIPPMLLALLRASIAFPVVWILARFCGQGLPANEAEWRTAAIGGLLIVAIPFSAIALGQRHIASGLAGVLYSFMPVMTAAFAHFLIPEERLSARKLLGLGAALCGLVAVLGPSTALGLAPAPVGEAITLMAPLSYALGTVLLKRREAINPLRLTTGMLLVGQVMMLPLVLLTGTTWYDLAPVGDARTGVLLIGLAVLGTAAPAILNYLLILRSGATNASLVMFYMPIVALLLGSGLLAERVHPGMIVGLAFVLFGSLAVTRSTPSQDVKSARP